METLQLDLNKRYTYADYLTWEDDKRRELIDGKVFEYKYGNPPIHQNVLGRLMYLLGDVVKKHNYAMYTYLDVRFPEAIEQTNDNQIFSVLQPDLFIVKDKSRLQEQGLLGAPDFIIEVIADETVNRDLFDKFDFYDRHKIPEYWIVHPEKKTVMPFVFNKKKGYLCGTKVYESNSRVKVNVLEDMYIDLADVFE